MVLNAVLRPCARVRPWDVLSRCTPLLPDPNHLSKRQDAWDSVVLTSSKVTQESIFRLNELTRDISEPTHYFTIMPLGHHSTRQMSCPEVGNDRHTSKRRKGHEPCAYPEQAPHELSQNASKAG